MKCGELRLQANFCKNTSNLVDALEQTEESRVALQQVVKRLEQDSEDKLSNLLSVPSPNVASRLRDSGTSDESDSEDPNNSTQPSFEHQEVVVVGDQSEAAN